jgi:hypothetical protein
VLRNTRSTISYLVRSIPFDPNKQANKQTLGDKVILLLDPPGDATAYSPSTTVQPSVPSLDCGGQFDCGLPVMHAHTRILF